MRSARFNACGESHPPSTTADECDIEPRARWNAQLALMTTNQEELTANSEEPATNNELTTNNEQRITNGRLMLIDGHALVHRAFHAVPPLTTSKGELTNAVFGFSNILIKEIGSLHPTHIIMALDRPAPTFRHVAYAEYKATRPATPQPLTSQFQRVREVAEAMHIPIYELDGFEADDVLGTLALQAEERGLPAIIVTGDLDALQLVSDGVRVLTPGRGITETLLYDTDAVRRRYGLEPAQLPDWKALVGDTSDNIPGVRGIGGKTASELLSKYGTLENLFDHLDEIAEKRRTLLEPAREQALQSKHLARIVRDAPITLRTEDSAFEDVDRAQLIGLFRELEFHSLIPRVQEMLLSGVQQAVRAPGPPGSATQLSIFETDRGNGSGSLRQASLVDAGPAVLVDVHVAPAEIAPTEVARTKADLARLVEELQSAPIFAVDTETTSTDPLRAKLVGLSFAVSGDKAWYVPVGHASGEQLVITDVIDALRPILEDASLQKTGHNLKYDYQVLRRYGVRTQALEFDTMIAAYLANPVRSGLSLTALALARLGIEMTPIESLIGKGRHQITMDLVGIETVAAYAGADAAVTFRLTEILRTELDQRELTKLFQEVEMPLVTVLADMELTGVALDTTVLGAMSSEMTRTIARLTQSIYDHAGFSFNISSTQQLGQLLFQQMKLAKGRRTKTGYSTDSDVLEALRGEHPIVDEILEHRQLLKLKNTYVDALPSLINPETGKIHTDFNQCVAATGRLSSSNPNLQNIPIRGEVGRTIRKAFVPGKQGNVLLAADYSQIELRILASMSGDERLLAAFQSGEDVHRATASAVFGVPVEKVTQDHRRIAKVVNFGIIYGIGEQRLAQETGITRAEAADFIESYNRTYSGVKAFMDRQRGHAVMYGYSETLLGRRRYIPDIHSSHPGVRAAAERAAINMPIQGTAADIIKVAMIRLHRELPERHPGAAMVLQVHDELVFDVPEHELQPVADLVCDAMVEAVTLEVPLEVEMKAGKDWYDMETVSRAG
jgi:DNA polymerase-1